jgi:hypothetical protein
MKESSPNVFSKLASVDVEIFCSSSVSEFKYGICTKSFPFFGVPDLSFFTFFTDRSSGLSGSKSGVRGGELRVFLDVGGSGRYLLYVLFILRDTDARFSLLVLSFSTTLCNASRDDGDVDRLFI